MIKPSYTKNSKLIDAVIEKVKWLESLTVQEREDYFNNLYSFQERAFSDRFMFFGKRSSRNVLDGQYESIARFYVSLSLGTINLNKTAEQFPAIKVNLKTKKVIFTITSSIAVKTNNYLIIPLNLSEIKKEDIIESINLLLLFNKDLKSVDLNYDWIDELIVGDFSKKELNEKTYDVLIGGQFEKSILQINKMKEVEQDRSDFLKGLFKITQFKESTRFRFYPSAASFDLIDETYYDFLSFELFDFFLLVLDS